MEVEHAEHCSYQIRYHFVWGVKFRRNVLFGERIKYLKNIICQIGERYEYNIEAVGIDEDHVHVFAGAHPIIPPARLVQVIKSITAIELFKKYPDIRRFLWRGALWQIGYYVRTVSDGPLEQVIKRYVEKQGTKAKPASYQLKLVP